MLIAKPTENQILFCHRIIRELIKRPQMPVGILASVIGCEAEETQRLIDHLEYQGSITKRVNKDFLSEAEGDIIQKLHEEIQKRLSEERIKSLPISELEKLLESSLERKKILEGGSNESGKKSDTSYIDSLIKNPKAVKQ